MMDLYSIKIVNSIQYNCYKIVRKNKVQCLNLDLLSATDLDLSLDLIFKTASSYYRCSMQYER